MFIQGVYSINIQNINFTSNNLSLRGVVYFPSGQSGPFPAIVVCHPHPQYGGSMDNNVVNSVCEAIVNKSFICLKFNFRGVNGSQGIFDNGRGEKEDVLSAISFITSLKEVDQNAIGLVGYSRLAQPGVWQQLVWTHE